MASPERLIGKDKMAELAGCSPRTVQEKCAARVWPHCKPAGRLAFKPEHVAYILALGETWPTEKPAEAPAPHDAAPAPQRRRRGAETAPGARGNVTPLRSKLAPRLAGRSA